MDWLLSAMEVEDQQPWSLKIYNESEMKFNALVIY